MGQYGLPSEQHNQFQSSDYETMIQSILSTKKNPIIMDICAGGGRDSVMMHDFAKAHSLNPLSIALDCDPNKLYGAQKNFEGRFEQVANYKQVAETHTREKISYVIEELPHLQTGLSAQMLNPALSKAKIDFMLCNAGIMFIKRENLQKSLQQMVNMLSSDREGQLLLGFSTTRPKSHYAEQDQRYTQQEIGIAINSLTGIQLPIVLDDLNDAINGGRGFQWHYRLITRTPV